jgi:3-keto-5-aminohexanoate cleavage enzyme
LNRAKGAGSVHKIDFSEYKDVPPYMFIPFAKDAIMDMSYHDKWDIPEKVGITVAPVGAFVKRDQNPYQPYTPEEIIKECIESVEAGACGVHIHVRDEQGNPSCDRTMTLQVINALRERFGGDVYIEGESNTGPDFETMMEPLVKDYIEMAAVNCMADFIGDALFCLPPQTCKATAEVIQACGKKIVLAIYNAGDIDNTYRWIIKPGIVKPPFCWGVCIGTPGGAPMWDPLGMAETLVGIIRRIRDVDDTPHPFITVCQAGRASTYLSTLAILLGCNVRVGKEDAVHVLPHRDDKIVTCKSAVEQHVTLARLLGREPMTAVEYRKAAGMKPYK